jgi:uncharacterized protein (TIGR02996 family)
MVREAMAKRKKTPATARLPFLDATGQALLAAVCDRPHDDDQRRVYADWLEEHGEADRAEAIRLEVRRRSLDEFDPEVWVINTVLQRFRDRHWKTWQSEFPQLPGVTWLLTGGLTDSVRVDSPHVLREHEDAIFAAAPITTVCTFFVTIQEGDPIPGCPEAFADCWHLDRLRKLDLNGMTRPETFGIDQLARLPGLSGLRELRLRESAHEDRMLEHLATCPAWPSLESLDLYRGMFGPPGLRALARAPLLASLRSLNLDRCGIGDTGLRELLRSPHLTRLRKLNLDDNGLTSRVMKTLVEYPWEHLERLNLSSNELTGAGVRTLVASPRLATLRSLDLGGNLKIGGDGTVALARSPNLGALCDLDLGWWGLTPRGLAALAQAMWFPQLRRLRLGGFGAGREGLEVLAAAPLSALRSLELFYSDLDADCLRPLLAAPWVRGLTHLELSNNPLGEKGADLLATADGLDGLVELNLQTTEIPAEAGDRLRARFGDRVVLKASWE